MIAIQGEVERIISQQTCWSLLRVISLSRRNTICKTCFRAITNKEPEREGGKERMIERKIDR